jgi:hypothetical protein
MRLMNAARRRRWPGESLPCRKASAGSNTRRARAPTIADLDEAIFELSHLIAGLADVDGAVVMTKRFELLGFAAEIRGSDLPDVITVQRATDLEADRIATRNPPTASGRVIDPRIVCANTCTMRLPSSPPRMGAHASLPG